MLDQIVAILQPLLSGLAGQYGWIVTTLTWMATLRLVFKPLMSLLEAFVAATPGDGDNAFLAKLETSSIYKTVVYLLDVFASIKVPAIVKAVTK